MNKVKKGWVMKSKSLQLVTGLLVLLVSMLASVQSFGISMPAEITDANWYSMSSSTNGSVYAITNVVTDPTTGEYVCYVGGEFSEAGGVPANNIAIWNITTSTWSALGTGTNDTVKALVLNAAGTILYVGGYFTTADEVTVNGVAKCDLASSTWTALGTGVSGNDACVNALALNGTTLYVGGSFATVGNTLVPATVTANNIAMWDGTATWTAFGKGTNDEVNALVVNGADVYAGGWFTKVGTLAVDETSANYIAKWNGAAWSVLGAGTNGTDGYVNALAYDSISNPDILYVGGFFTNAGGSSANSIAQWDVGGAAWGTLGTGMYYEEVNCLSIASGSTDLYAGGQFTAADIALANNIAQWVNGTWYVLGSGTDNIVRAISFDTGKVPVLYAAGNFTKAGNKTSNYIAKCSTDNDSLLLAPVIGKATAGLFGSVTVTFDGTLCPKADVDSYTITASDGTSQVKMGGNSTSDTFFGLTQGKSYTFKVTATNGLGTSPASKASNAVIPVSTPGAPTIGLATAGAGFATVKFTPPKETGGSKILSYTATSSPAGFSATGKTSPVTVYGLAANTIYQFTVTANNAQGSSAPSMSSNETMTLNPTVPGAPTGVYGIRGNTTVTVYYTPPKSSGGSAITTYTAIYGTFKKSVTVSGINAKPILVTGLTNGKSYSFMVTATNAVGEGPKSKASKAVTPATVADKPVLGILKSGTNMVTVPVTVPNNGGTKVTSYTVTAVTSPAGVVTSTITSKTSPVKVTGLTGGQLYSFTAIASNAIGASPVSNPAIATPSAISAAPGEKAFPAPWVAPVAVKGNAQATITFDAPYTDGGSAITLYTATSNPGNKTGKMSVTGTPTSGSITVTGLTNGTLYEFTVTAKNAIGTSGKSLASNVVTPSTVPGAPTTVKAALPSPMTSPAGITVTFKAPTNNGGRSVTSYTATAASTGIGVTVVKTGTSSPLSMTGLTTGAAYTVTVKATNANGSGVASTKSNSITAP